MRNGLAAVEILVFAGETALGATVSVLAGRQFGAAGYVLGFLIGFGLLPGLFFALKGWSAARLHRRTRTDAGSE